MPGNTTEPSLDHPTLDAYVELLAEKEKLVQAVSEWENTCTYWYSKAKRAERRFRRLIVLSSSALAALALAHVWRSL